MRNLIMIASVVALSAAPAFAATSSAKPAKPAKPAAAAPAHTAAAPGGPYKLDASGKCHAANGAFAKQSMCPAKPAAATRCKDPKTKKFAKCGTPGAVPA